MCLLSNVIDIFLNINNLLKHLNEFNYYKGTIF